MKELNFLSWLLLGLFFSILFGGIYFYFLNKGYKIDHTDDY